jgi:hypothetical protein
VVVVPEGHPVTGPVAIVMMTPMVVAMVAVMLVVMPLMPIPTMVPVIPIAITIMVTVTFVALFPVMGLHDVLFLVAPVGVPLQARGMDEAARLGTCGQSQRQNCNTAQNESFHGCSPVCLRDWMDPPDRFSDGTEFRVSNSGEMSAGPALLCKSFTETRARLTFKRLQ